MHIKNILMLVCMSSLIQADNQKEYTPIVLVHGLISNSTTLRPSVGFIRKYMGDSVYVKSVEIGLGEVTTFANIYLQIEDFRKEIQADPELQNGFNMIGHSQGGLLARYFVQKYNSPQVFNLITWGAPHQGVFGVPGDFDQRFRWLDYIEAYAHNALYSWAFQKFVGFASYWHDTLHYETYLRHASFLPYANNEVWHSQANLFKKNICSLQNMVLVMSDQDEVIEPRISCHFGFYKVGSKTETQPIFEIPLYIQDTLGLRTLYESDRLHLRYAHCAHTQFENDEHNFVENTLEFLVSNPSKMTLIARASHELHA